MRRIASALLLGVLLLGSASKLDRLEADEKEHYDALRVWMSADQQKAYLKLKTRDLRDQYLKDLGYWNRFYQYNEEMREAIVAGEVREGWTQDAMYMAWGAPQQKQRIVVQGAERAEKMVYLLEVTDDGRVFVWEKGSKETHNAVEQFRYEVIVADGIVDQLNKKPGWQ